jgi:hypothetical protein
MKGKDFERPNEEKVSLKENIQGKMGELLELAGMGFFQVGDRYSLEQFLSDPGDWLSLAEEKRQILIEELGNYFGIDLLAFPEDKVRRRFQEEGKQLARVTVLETNSPFFEVYVVEYLNSSLGTRYDIVRAS